LTGIARVDLYPNHCFGLRFWYLNGMGHSVQSVNENSARPCEKRVWEIGAVSPLYDRRGSRKYLTLSERGAFLKAAKQMPPEVRTFCLMLAYTGARVSEVLALTPRRFDLAAHLVTIESLKKRRRGVYRAIPVPSLLLAELDEVHALGRARQDNVLADRRIWRWCRTSAWNHVKKCMILAQIAGPHATPKGLRHAFGVGTVQAGVPLNLLKKWLGHARLSTTEIYAEAVGSEEQAIATRFWRTF
jgi:integrase/recombinase XerD